MRHPVTASLSWRDSATESAIETRRFCLQPLNLCNTCSTLAIVRQDGLLSLWHQPLT
jgi:hypothetical protein